MTARSLAYGTLVLLLGAGVFGCSIRSKTHAADVQGSDTDSRIGSDERSDGEPGGDTKPAGDADSVTDAALDVQPPTDLDSVGPGDLSDSHSDVDAKPDEVTEPDEVVEPDLKTYTECEPATAVALCGAANLCVDGYCCNTICTGTCLACDLPGSEGSCTAVPFDEAADAECSDGLFCTSVDTCDGGGSCAHLGNPCEGGDVCNSQCNEHGMGLGDCYSSSGVPCGEGPAACSDQDTCDGAGACQPNHLPEDIVCSSCPGTFCFCAQGTCKECTKFAPTNHFTTPRSILGWELTGGWGLYREAPQNYTHGPTLFPSQVLGTDGNRAQPYPGSEAEFSFAISPLTVLPASIDFLSWHMDEGTIDSKRVRVTINGGATYVTLADCGVDATPAFCKPRNEERAGDSWDIISLPVPAEMVGELGLVEFTYNTVDACCSFEKGWYIDVANFATECACTLDEECAGYGGECGTGVCSPSGECELEPVPAGTACGDTLDVDCNAADACDGIGYCASNVAATGLSTCGDCPGGWGNCNVCQAGSCVDCVNLSATNDFVAGTGSIQGWAIEDLSGTGADWGIFSSAPANTEVGSLPIPLSNGPSLGTDGNRQAPYPGSEREYSRITTPLDTFPAFITFQSWHVDEGSTDNKIIELSVDDGQTWSLLVNCGQSVGGPQPFCVFVTNRLGSQWDTVVIDTAAYAGQAGRLRFTYDTGDSCCGFERGWFIDSINFAQYCTDPVFP